MDQKNFIVAIVLSVLIIVGWQAAFPPAKPPVNQQQTARRPRTARPAGAGQRRTRRAGSPGHGAARRRRPASQRRS